MELPPRENTFGQGGLQMSHKTRIKSGAAKPGNRILMHAAHLITLAALVSQASASVHPSAVCHIRFDEEGFPEVPARLIELPLLGVDSPHVAKKGRALPVAGRPEDRDRQQCHKGQVQD